MYVYIYIHTHTHTHSTRDVHTHTLNKRCVYIYIYIHTHTQQERCIYKWSCILKQNYNECCVSDLGEWLVNAEPWVESWVKQSSSLNYNKQLKGVFLLLCSCKVLKHRFQRYEDSGTYLHRTMKRSIHERGKPLTIQV